MSMMKAIFAATAMVVLPVAVSAATITLEPNKKGNHTFSLGSNETNTVNFQPTGPMNVEFIVAALGAYAADLENVKFGASYTADKKLSVFSFGGQSYGFGNIEFAAVEDAFSFFFTTKNAEGPVGYTVNWKTEAPAPVPLPAAGLLLGAAMLGLGGVAAKRRRKASEV